MQKFRKVLSVFLAVLMLASVFSINVSAEFIGTGAGIGDAAVNPSNYNTPVLNNTESSVVGYRFSIVDTTGNTIVKSSKFCTIDLIRTKLDSNDVNNVYAYADGNGKDGTNTSMKMRARLNKYQWNQRYRNNGEIDIGRVTSKDSAGTNTYGMNYVTNIGAEDLPYTTKVESWANIAENRVALLNALGYNTTKSNVDSALGRNRIVIEPLFRVKWDGRWTVFSACDLAIMNYAYYSNGNGNFPHGTGEKDGRYGQYGSVMIRRFTNGLYQECLHIGTDKKDLKMPSDAPLTHVSTLYNPNTSGMNKVKYLRTYDYILRSTLGMALYYNVELELQANAVLKVQFYDRLGNVKCDLNSPRFNRNDKGLLLDGKNGNKVFTQTIPVNGTDANGLVNSTTFGLSAPDGYHWNVDKDGNRTWRFYSYNSPSANPRESYWLLQPDQGTIASAKDFWKAIYYDYKNVTKTSTGERLSISDRDWRYGWSGAQKSELAETQIVSANPDIRENKVTIVYHNNGAGTAPSSVIKKYSEVYPTSNNCKITIKNISKSDSTLTFKGWSLDEDRDANDFNNDTNASQDFVVGDDVKLADLIKAVNKEEDFKKGDITIDLYAVWDGSVLIIKYNPNGGRGKVANQTVTDVFVINNGNKEVNTTKSVKLYDKTRVTATASKTKGEIPFERYGYELTGWERRKTALLSREYLLNEFILGANIKPAGNLQKFKRHIPFFSDYSSVTSMTLNAVWREKNEKTQINIGVTPDIVEPNVFKDKWDSPLGTTEEPKAVHGYLYYEGERIRNVTITMSGNNIRVNGSLEALEYGNYTLKLYSPTSDSYLVGTVNGEQYKGTIIEIPLTLNGTAQTLNFELKNYTHTINVDYKTQFNDFQNTTFGINLTMGEGEAATTISETYYVDYNGKKTLIVPGYVIGDDGSVMSCSYSTYMASTPEYYTPDDRVYNTGEIDYLKDNVYDAEFENWYIWDFGITAEPSATIVDKGQTFDVKICAKNPRPRTNSPAATVEILLDSEVINTHTVTISGRSEINETIPVTIPEDAELGNHTVTVKINYDKYLEWGYDYLFEENMEDNQASFEIGVEWTPKTQEVYAVIWRDRTAETSPLKDYSMNLYKESGELIKTVATDEKGVASFGNIDEGLYYVEVTTSQTGYQYLVADGLQNVLSEASRKDTQRFDIVVDKDNVVDVKVAEGKTVVDSGKKGVVAPFWLESNATVKVTGNIDSNAWYVPDTAQFNIGSTASTFRAGETTEQFIYIRELAVNGTFNVTAPVSEKECFKWSVVKSDNSKASSITVSDNDLINAPNHIYNVVLDYAMLCSATYTVTFSSDDGSPIPNGKTVSLVAKYTNATGNGEETVTSAVIENGKVTFTNIDIGKNKGYTEYSLVIPSDIAGSGYTVALFDGASSVSVDTFRVHDHKAAATYKIVKDAVSKGNIIIDVSSIVTAPTQFADKWNNPEGKTSVVTLYVNGTVKATKNVTIPKSGGTVNTITFANVEVGTYKVEITVPTKDCYYDKNGETAATVTLNHTGLQTKQSFVLKNNTHTVNITYTNQFNEHLDDAVFTTTIYKDGTPVGTVSLKPAPDGKLHFTVPACDDDGHIYTYSTVMGKAPTNYSKDTTRHTADGFPTNASTHADMSFKSWYIWDFSVTAKLSDASQTEYESKGGFERGESVNVIVTARNARSHKNSPNVTVEIFFDNQLIKTATLAINANSISEITVPVTIPSDAGVGIHRITAYINYDKYSQCGEGYLYETAVADNTSILDFKTADGDIMIAPVAINGIFCTNDTVFASFYVYNNGLNDILKENGATVEATLFYTSIDGTDKSVVLDKVENVVIPNYSYVDNRNLVYFKFVIPVDAKLNVNCAVMATVNGGTAFDTDDSNNKAAVIRTVRFRATSNTPDYGRALNTPRGMLDKCGVPNLTRYAEKTTSSAIGNVASWTEWVEQTDKTLKIQSYAVKANLDAIVKIDNRCLTAAFEDGDLVLKSGYGVTLAVQPIIEATSGVTDAMFGRYNTANAYYPEYGYSKEIGKYSTLQLLTTDTERNTSQFTSASAFTDRANTHDVPILGTAPRWELPQCTFSSFYDRGNGMARKHFTPLWWKDGRYTIVCDVTELWTPAGVVGAEAIAHSGEGGDVYISGSVYDNYYTARG